MRCPKCGNELNQEEAFCGQCGAPTSISSVNTTIPVNYAYWDDPYNAPPIPPPPPRIAKNHRRRVAIAAIIIVSLLLAAAFTYIIHNPIVISSPPKSIPSASTPIPATPTAKVTITAMQIYLVFEHHGLTKNDGVENDSEYQSQGVHNPEGGVVDFTDASSGQPYTISVFATSTQASQAATILFNGGDNSYGTDGFCMLHVSFASHASNFALQQYTTIMDTLCKHG